MLINVCIFRMVYLYVDIDLYLCKVLVIIWNEWFLNIYLM